MTGYNHYYEPVEANPSDKQKYISKSKYDKQQAARGKHTSTNTTNVREVGTAGSKSLRTQSKGSGVGIGYESSSEGERMMFPMDPEEWKPPGSSKTPAQQKKSDKTTPRFAGQGTPFKNVQEKQAVKSKDARFQRFVEPADPQEKMISQIEASKQAAKAKDVPFQRFVSDPKETQASKDAAKRKEAKVKKAKAEEQERLKAQAKLQEQAMIKEAAEAREAAKKKAAIAKVNDWNAKFGPGMGKAGAPAQKIEDANKTHPRFVENFKQPLIGGPKTPKPKFPRDDGVYTMNQGPDSWTGHICDYPGATDNEGTAWQAQLKINENALGLTDEQKMRRKCKCPRIFYNN